MNFKGTQGNWYIEKRRNTLLEIRSDFNNKIIAECENYEYNKQTMSIYECEANARLIAAAPELLEELIHVNKLLKCIVSSATKPTIERIKQLIKKATE